MRRFSLLPLCVLPLSLWCSSAAQAQSLEAVVDPAASASVFEFDSELNTDGTLIGDFDPDDNPGGTQTRPGLIGGSGNQPIPISLDLLSGSGGESSPAGTFSLGLDITSLAGTWSDLGLELAPETGFASTVSARLSYPAFNTVSPPCTFPSIGSITLPIGEIGRIRDVRLQQSEAASLQLENTPDPERYSFEVTIPAVLSLLVDTDFAEEPLPLADVPVSLPLSGSLKRSGPDRFDLQASLAPQSFDGSLELGGIELPPIPLPLPCVLPPGAEANLIMNLAANALDFELEFGFELTAELVGQTVPDPIFADGFEQP